MTKESDGKHSAYVEIICLLIGCLKLLSNSPVALLFHQRKYRQWHNKVKTIITGGVFYTVENIYI